MTKKSLFWIFFFPTRFFSFPCPATSQPFLYTLAEVCVWGPCLRVGGTFWSGYVLYLLQKDWAEVCSLLPHALLPPSKTSWNCRQTRAAVHCFTRLCAKEWKRSDRAALPTHMGRGKHLTPWSTGMVWMRVQSPCSSSQPHLDVFSPAGWPSCSDVRRKLWVTGKGFETRAKLNQLMGSVCHWQLSLSIKPVADIPGRPHTRHPPGLGYLEWNEAGLYGCCM